MEHTAQSPRLLPLPRRYFRPRAAIVNQIAAIAAVVIIVIGLGASFLKYGGGFGTSSSPTDQLEMAWQASPEASVPTVPFTEPKPEDCTVEPLTVDQTMEKLLGFNQIDNAVNIPAIPDLLSPSTREELVAAQREWLACILYGSPFHKWALETGLLVRQDLQSLSWPFMNPNELRSELEAMKEERKDGVRSEPIDFGDSYLPMVGGIAAYDGQYPRDVAAITITWVNQYGDQLSAEHDGEIGVGLYWAYRELPNTFKFTFDSDKNLWLLSGFEQGHG